MTPVGIEALNAFGGTACLDVHSLAQHRGLDLTRFENLLMSKKTVALPQEDPVTYPFTSYAGDVTFEQPWLGDRTVDFNTEGVAHIYRAAVTRDKLLRTRLRELADRFTGGAATPLVQALVDGHRFTRDEIEQFRELLDQIEAQDERKKGKPRAK